MISYNELLSQIIKGSVISFKEYSLDMYGKKHLAFEIENSLVQDIIPANNSLSKEILEEYYGSNLSPQDYLQLSSVNCVRFILLIKIDENNHPVYKPILFNKDYYEQGLQEIKIINGVIQNEPIYIQSTSFNSFEVIK